MIHSRLPMVFSMFLKNYFGLARFGIHKHILLCILLLSIYIFLKKKKNQWFSCCLRVTVMPFLICLIASCHDTKLCLKGKKYLCLLPQWPLNKYLPSIDISVISVWNLLLPRGTHTTLQYLPQRVYLTGGKDLQTVISSQATSHDNQGCLEGKISPSSQET